MIFNNLTKELCNHCRKGVGLGLPHYECFRCNHIFHAKCFKHSAAQVIDNKFYCSSCKHLVPIKYNPFKHMIDSEIEDVDPCIQGSTGIPAKSRSRSKLAYLPGSRSRSKS